MEKSGFRRTLHGVEVKVMDTSNTGNTFEWSSTVSTVLWHNGILSLESANGDRLTFSKREKGGSTTMTWSLFIQGREEGERVPPVYIKEDGKHVVYFGNIIIFNILGVVLRHR